MNSLAKKLAWGTLGVEGNYVWCLAIVAIFMELGGAKRSEGLKVIIWWASHNGQRAFSWGELNPLDTMSITKGAF